MTHRHDRNARSYLADWPGQRDWDSSSGPLAGRDGRRRRDRAEPDTRRTSSPAAGGSTALVAVNCAYRSRRGPTCCTGRTRNSFGPGIRPRARFPASVLPRAGDKPNAYGIPEFTNTGEEGLELDPTGLRNGQNSAYAAINLAVHMGARTVVLLGVDAGREVLEASGTITRITRQSRARTSSRITF